MKNECKIWHSPLWSSRGWTNFPERNFFAESFPAFRRHIPIIFRWSQRPALLKYLYDVILNAWGAIFFSFAFGASSRSILRPCVNRGHTFDFQRDWSVIRFPCHSSRHIVNAKLRNKCQLLQFEERNSRQEWVFVGYPFDIRNNGHCS